MNTHRDFHPSTEWVNIKAELYEEDAGSCVKLILRDSKSAVANIVLHYGFGKEDANKFVIMLKEAISKLPVRCETCGQEIRGG